MPPTPIEVAYNDTLSDLTRLLGTVNRFGDFAVQGKLEAAMPRLEVNGVGRVAFPVLPEQAKALIAAAEQAPHGKGTETIVDRNVRRVWQHQSEGVKLAGKTWNTTMDAIVAAATAGLGVDGGATAELYKLLMYETGDFFVSHRDTEKVDGMFGTLVVSLPSTHRGAELVVRHANRELVLDLASGDESELSFAAFYADCEHEIRPLTSGYRVCLVYNLIAKKKARAIRPPLHNKETQQVASSLQALFAAEDAPDKLVYALEHQYSTAGLSFAALKGVDAARADVFERAARVADCALHLGIVHITEYGAAELLYDNHQRYGRGYGGYHPTDDGGESDDLSSGVETDFEVVDVTDSSSYISDWRATPGQASAKGVDFGKLPLGDDELIPAGCFKDAKPDSQWVTEATGNEGASFERAYRRAALVLWPAARGFEVLLAAGVKGPLTHLEALKPSRRGSATAVHAAAEAQRCAEQLVGGWQAAIRRESSEEHGKLRARALMLLSKIDATKAVDAFVSETVLPSYDGSENRGIVAAESALGSVRWRELLTQLFQQKAHTAFVQLVELAELVAKTKHEKATHGSEVTCLQALLDGLDASPANPAPTRWNERDKQPITGKEVAHLLRLLATSAPKSLLTRAMVSLSNNPVVFVPDTVLLPALTWLRENSGVQDTSFVPLWQHVANFVLARSEFAPAAPTNWVLPMTESPSRWCTCELCVELDAFARSETQQEHRFRVRKDLRQHLHTVINHRSLDMTHVTLREGSPQTLVCKKTRRTYEQQCEQYRKDRLAMQALLEVEFGVLHAGKKLVVRVEAAATRPDETQKIRGGQYEVKE